MSKKNTYTVNFGNVGNIHYTNKKDALKCFNDYTKLSQSKFGRASEEDVYLFQNDEIIKEYLGTMIPEDEY